MEQRALRLATRGSPLARWQAEWVAHHLDDGGASRGDATEQAIGDASEQPFGDAPEHGHVDSAGGPGRRRRTGVGVELIIVETVGDRRQDVPLSAVGGQGVFVKEVQAAVLEGRAEAAVHSAKDLPSVTVPGLCLAAIAVRDDARDALVGSCLRRLPSGGLVATGSVRRRAQLANLRPDLTFADLRGNIGSRLAKAGGFDAILMAVAALRRLGMADRVAQALDPELMVPQVGQGAIAIECREDDAETRALLAVIDHQPTHRAVVAERAFLATLGSGCTLPVGAFATSRGPGRAPTGAALEDADAVPELLTLLAVIATPDGRVVLRHRDSGMDPTELGVRVGHHLLHTAGGDDLLDLAPRPEPLATLTTTPGSATPAASPSPRPGPGRGDDDRAP